MAAITKVVIWRLPNGCVSITSFMFEAMQRDETVEEFIQREVDKMIALDTSLVDVPYFIKDRSEVLNLISNSDRERLKCSSNGALSIDSNMVTEKDRYQAKIDSITTKLKSLGLSDSDINFLTRR